MKTLKQFQEAATGYRKVKSPDEQKFIDKHEVETVPDKNGNGDEVFKASNVKKVERKKERKGYEPGEDESVYEEAEQVDEGLGGAYRYNQMMKRKRNEYLGMVKKHQDAGHDLETAKNKASQELDALEAKRRKNARPLPQTRDLMKKEEFEQAIEGLSPRLQETMYNIHDRLNEENRDKFVAACQTEEGLEKMIAFAIENRGE